VAQAPLVAPALAVAQEVVLMGRLLPLLLPPLPVDLLVLRLGMAGA